MESLMKERKSRPRKAGSREEKPRADPDKPSYVVGIGASAGGLEALRSFFAAMPPDSGMAFVVIQHLAPNHKSLMAELLGRSTEMPVARAEEGGRPLANHVYLIPPGFNLTLSDAGLRLERGPGGGTLNLPIDIFFRSLAKEHGDRAVAIVLSGTGSDGARGIRAVKEAGGMIMVQAEASAKFAGMPASAIATGAADFILPVEEMPSQLVNFARHPYARRQAGELAQRPDFSGDLERICSRVKQATGIDFTHYKQATLARRIERRINILQVQDIGEYVQFLSRSPQEAEALGKDLLIGVTKFFRDPESFEVLSKHLDFLFAELPPGGCLRLWSAACSTGEEAYTLAMLCEEIRAKGYPQAEFKVFATDVDKAALEIASAGVYPRSVVADVPPDLLKRYFLSEGSENFRVQRPLRDRLIFARQDLLSDPPFTKIDVVVCRNLLIYLQPQAQRKLLALFHFSLVAGGLMFLGGSESLGDVSYAFDAVDGRHRIHRKKRGVSLRVSDALPRFEEKGRWTEGRDHPGGRSMRGSRASAPAEAIQRHLLKTFAPATVVVNARFELLYTIGPVSPYFRLPEGPMNLDVLKMVPRDLSLALNTAATQALRGDEPVEFRAVNFTHADGRSEPLRVRAETFDTQGDEGRVVLLNFLPDTCARERAREGEAVVGEDFQRERELINRIAELEQELATTRESLQASVEQQETANEELQAANEELLASNEELQSTNEELESVNEELYTVNAEYQGKIHELTEITDDLENFASSTDIGTVFFDRSMRIRRFTPVFGRLTELTESDAGRSLSTFAHPVLRSILAAAPDVLSQKRREHEETVDLGESGTFLLRVIPYRVEDGQIEGLVGSLVDVSRLTDAEEELKAIVQTVNVGICVTDESGRFLEVNEAYLGIYGYTREELIGELFTLVVPEDFRKTAQRLHDSFMETGQEIPAVWTVVDKMGKIHRVAVQARLLRRSDGSRRKITVVTDLADLERLQKQAPVEKRNAREEWGLRRE